jgi:hypothetical protein
VRAKRSKYPAPVEGLQASDINCNQVQSNVPVIQSESVSESESNARGKRTRFVPPTVEECDDFFKGNGSTVVEATKFHCYYSSNGWRVGKGPMKDWQASARGWIARNTEGFGAGGGKSPPVQDPHMLRYTPEERKKTYGAAIVDFDEA